MTGSLAPPTQIFIRQFEKQMRHSVRPGAAPRSTGHLGIDGRHRLAEAQGQPGGGQCALAAGRPLSELFDTVSKGGRTQSPEIYGPATINITK
jgi:hypothetical protein